MTTLTRAESRSYGTSVPDGCFADEIDIDFPAVGRVVDGMREAFLGEAPRRNVLAAEVLLSRREAAGGLVVCVTLPIRGVCPPCGGRGESWTEACAQCRGTGESLFQHPVRFAVPAGVADGTTFRFRVTPPHSAPIRVEVRVAVQRSLV